VDESNPSGERGLQEALRAAVERTLAATAGSAAETRGRAQELLDEVARRGQGAREGFARRGQEARETSSTLTGRVVEAIREMRLASGEEVRALGYQLETIERRVAALETRLVGTRPAPPAPDSEPDVEGK
jgi:polyhydroxyalkanoate synthesis regulator phasin